MAKRILATVLVVAFLFAFVLSTAAFATPVKIPEVPEKPTKPSPAPIVIIPVPPTKPAPVPV
ncbi:hypothetical protein SAMN05216182_0001, partial [Caldicellulosiruptor bescii]